MKRATDAKERTGIAQIQEEIQLAWNAVQVDGVTKGWDNSTKAGALNTELLKEDGNASASWNDTNSVIDVTYKGYTTTINPNTGTMTTLAKAGTGNNDENDIYRGLASENDVVEDLYFYEILSEEHKTAKITGINLEYIFTEALGDHGNPEYEWNWPDISEDTSSGSNSDYINAMNQYVSNLVIPYEISLNGQTYKITKIETLLYPYNQTNPETGDPYYFAYDSSYNYGREYLWGSEDLNLNIIIPNGIEYLDLASDGYDLVTNPNPIPGLNSINLPSTLTTIGGACFAGFSELTSIVLPDSVKTLGNGAFSGCNKLVRMTGPINMSNSGESSYYENYFMPQNLETFISSSGSKVGDCLFYGLESLMSVSLPDNLEEIGFRCFYRMHKFDHFVYSKQC